MLAAVPPQNVSSVKLEAFNLNKYSAVQLGFLHNTVDCCYIFFSILQDELCSVCRTNY